MCDCNSELIQDFARYFVDCSLDGSESEGFDCGDGCGGVDYYSIIDIQPEDRAMFPDDLQADHVVVCVRTDNFGFHEVTPLTQVKLGNMLVEYETFCESMTDAD